jgi:3-deoxy-manno-octulosonate cytidylyltransferase (CMP-KDO synthetase)
MIDESLKPFEKNKGINVVNLFSKFKDFEEYSNEDTIKVIRDQKNNAIFFGRKLNNNYFNNNKKSFVGKQVCIIPFKRKYLIKFLKLKPSNLEIVESVDMWRFLENGIKVYMQDTNYLSFAVDHPRDVKKVSKYLPKNINV